MGRRYKLHIRLNEGDRYKSSWVTLKKSPPIDSVYTAFEEKATTNKDEPLFGFQTYLDTHDPANGTRFYRWEWDETWQYAVPFPETWKYLGNNLLEPLNEAKEFCYTGTSSNTIIIGSSVGNGEDVISRQPISFVSTATNRLRLKYSLSVKQYALEEEEYFFWKGLQETNNDLGTLFDRQPQSVVGNIKNLDNPGVPVLGYFSASGVSESRIFLSRWNVPAEQLVSLRIPTGYHGCALDTLLLSEGATDEQIFKVIDIGTLVFYNFHTSLSGRILGYLFATKECSDCTLAGGVTEKPDFWED